MSVDIITPSLHGSIDYMDTMGKERYLFIYYFCELLKQKGSGNCADSFFSNFKMCYVEISVCMTSYVVKSL